MTSADITIVAMTREHAAYLSPTIAAEDPWHRLGIGQGAIEAMLTADWPDHIQRAIVRDGAPVGAIVVHLDWLLGPYLRHLSVLKSARSDGIGACAIDWLAELARQRDQSNLWLCVSEFNVSARRFYARHGFKEATVLGNLVVPGENEVLMRRQLAT